VAVPEMRGAAGAVGADQGLVAGEVSPLVAHSPQGAGEAVLYPAEPREIRVCAHPDCDTRLRRGHGPYCCLHEHDQPLTRTQAIMDAKVRREGTRRSAEVRTKTCALESCGHDFETRSGRARYCSNRCRARAYKERQKSGARDRELDRHAEMEDTMASIKQRLREHLEGRRGAWCDPEDLMKSARINSRGSLQGHICHLRKEGLDVETGERGYRVRPTAVAAEESKDERPLHEIMLGQNIANLKDAPSTPAGAAPDLPPEQPAEPPAAPSPSTTEPPAAGIDPEDGMTDQEAADRLCDAIFAEIDVDPEVAAISAIVEGLRPLTLGAKKRVLTYVMDREFCDEPDPSAVRESLSR